MRSELITVKGDNIRNYIISEENKKFVLVNSLGNWVQIRRGYFQLKPCKEGEKWIQMREVITEKISL
jgi:hypothetical protein